MVSSSETAIPVDGSKLTVLDRRIDVILENPDHTASRKFGVTSALERLHRFHGTSLILRSCKGLSLSPSTYATACTIFHRFYYTSSLTDYDVWSVAMASTLLATKIEEDPKTIKAIIEEYANIYARRIILADLTDGNNDANVGYVCNDNGNNNKDDRWSLIPPSSLGTTLMVECEDAVLSSAYLACLPQRKNKAKFRPDVPIPRVPINNFGQIYYRTWHDEITKMESILLRRLGFTFHWISDSHPHKFILAGCQALDLTDEKFTQKVWDYCNDSCRLDLSLRFLPEVIATGAILLAARDFDIVLPLKPRPWWQFFLGTDEDRKGHELVEAANAILGACNFELGPQMDRNHHNTNDTIISKFDWLAASFGFLHSLIVDKKSLGEEKLTDNVVHRSFNDPESYIWFCEQGRYEK